MMVVVTGIEEAKHLLPLAEAIINDREGQLLLLLVMPVPEGQPLNEAAANASRTREGLTNLMSESTNLTTQLRTMVRPSRQIWDGIWETVAGEQIRLMAFDWCCPLLADQPDCKPFSHPQLRNPPCDLVVVRSTDGPDAGEISDVKRILLPVRGGPRSALALRVAHALARQADAEITLLHVEAPGVERKNQFQEEFAPAIRGLRRVSRSITVKGEIETAILHEVAEQDRLGKQIVVIGSPCLPEGGAFRPPVAERLEGDLPVMLVAVRDHCMESNLQVEFNEPLTVRMDRPVAVMVDNWFAENTFHSREFADLERLVGLKESQGVTISLGLPALNEQETVGQVISTVKKALMDDVPLLDEIVLIDSGSTDYTREIAADLGIPVYIHQEILPQYGAYHGKGEALWKSLYVLNGDIIAWIDTDIINIHPRFVYGILGPLLLTPHIQYVKGFYRRPLRKGDTLVAGGGGRVTELTARPFFNLFFPELSGVIQPLSGEYAGRRSALEQMPFFTGYGVETGLLIDLLETFGLQAIAQSDLLERIHHNQPLPSLSKMSFAIMQVVISRLERRHDVRLLDEANTTMNLIRYGVNRRYYLQPEVVQEFERPPMITLPEYRQKRGLPAEVRPGGGVV